MDLKPYKFIDKIAALPFVEAIYLYGSRARGDNMPTSDIDLAILCPTATLEEWYQIEDIIENADTLLDMNYLRLDKTKGEIINEIERDKVVLYERLTR